MSAINGINYQSALTILSQSSRSAEVRTPSGAAGLVNVARQAGASSNSGSSSGTPADTVSLSDQAKSSLTALLNADASNNPPSGSPASQSATDGLNIEIQLLQQRAAVEGRTATVQNASDVPGLNFQENAQAISGGTRVSVNFNSQVFQANPNNVIVFDSNPADAKLVTA